MPTCFVIMGYGEKSDFATGRKLDLDKSYKNIIKPAVVRAGYDCVRADEVLHSGVIDVPMYQQLFAADLVVADLSTSNLNATFELGVRHALKPKSTIIIAEEQFRSPFDVNHVVIRRYVHLGPDIGYDEAERMQAELTTLAAAIKNNGAVDSPVYVTLSDLEPPKRRLSQLTQGAAVAHNAPIDSAPEDDKETYAALLEVAVKAKGEGNFDLAKAVLMKIYLEQTEAGSDGQPKPARPRIVQELALATYKAGEKAAETAGPSPLALTAYAEAEALLCQLDPELTTDPETLGLWSAIHKRRAELTTRSEAQRRADLDVAILAAERGFVIRGDHYTGTNLGYLLDLRASLSSGDEQIADRILASRVRRRVVEISTARLKLLEGQKAGVQPEIGVTPALEEDKYWTTASLAESLIVLGDGAGHDLLQKAVKDAPARWMADSTLNQFAKLQALLKR